MQKETIAQVLQFVKDRNWDQFHNPKDLAISICLEAAELLEIYQWSGEDTQCRDKINNVSEELADVLIYCIQMSYAYGLDMDEIIKEKLKRNAQKYPIEQAYGSKEKYTQLKNQTDNV